MTLKVHLIAAARPNFMKVAPLLHALNEQDWCEAFLVHTGQHYDANMADVFFRDLNLPTPHFSLGVGSGTHAEQTGGVMIAYEKVCVEHRPDWIVVVGDVNSTAACAMVGAKLQIPVIHLEAGLRSRDRGMPEEINRLVTDAISDVLWTPSADANQNLAAEGVPDAKIDLIGNIMIDSFEMLRGKIECAGSQLLHSGDSGKYALVTLHRPSNVDHKSDLGPIVDALVEVSELVPLVFVAHPRTMARIEDFGFLPRFDDNDRMTLLKPQPYVDFMGIATKATMVITDSGGLQEETTYLGIPCMTLRDNTERPVTVTMGTNRLIQADDLTNCVAEVLSGDWPEGTRPPLWDGKTASRAVECLRRRIQG